VPTLRLVHPHPARADGSYEGPTGSWRVGDVREVSEDEARVLREDWPPCFEVVSVVPGAARDALHRLDAEPVRPRPNVVVLRDRKPKRKGR